MTAGQEVPSLVCDLALGRPGLTVHNELRLSGWAVSPQGMSGVAVQIGERQWNAGYGLDTPSVMQRLPDILGSERAGYELRIDTSGWEAGPHYVTVAAFDATGGRTAIEGEVEVLPFEPAPAATTEDNLAALAADGVALSLEQPRPAEPAELVDGTVEISGWAYASGGIEAVVVTVDGRHQHEAPRPVARPDLADDYGPEVAAEAGFVSRLDIAQCPPGRHSLLVVAIGRDGGAVGVEREIAIPLEAEIGPGRQAATHPRAGAHDEPGPDADLAELLRHWRDRALLAEADAAVSRTESDIARTQQERTAWELQQLEAQLAEARRRVAALEGD